MNSHDDPSRLYKWLLLICSLICIGFLAASAAKEMVWSEWQVCQGRYRQLLRQKAKDAAQRQAAAEFSVELRQVAVPALNATDRCVSCHLAVDDSRMVDTPEPYRAHPAGILRAHPMDKFGCTICHNGQGALLTRHEVHAADVDWAYPMLPLEYTQASCGSCHDARRLPPGEAPLLLRGAQLFEERSCRSCHKVNRRGGPLGPALDNEGMKGIHQFPLQKLKGNHTTWNWLAQHFRDPAALVPGSLMKSMSLNDAEIKALTVYMLSLRQRVLPQTYLARDKLEQMYEQWHPSAPQGSALYQQYCFACHGSGEESRLDEQFSHFVPAIRGASLLRTASRDFLIANIRQGRSGAPMPSWDAKSGGLSETEIEAIADYLRRDAGRLAPVSWPAPGTVTRGDPGRGAGLFVKHCADCHAVNGTGAAPDLFHPTFQKIASDAFIWVTVRDGRADTLMQPFQPAGGKGLRNEELADLLAYIRRPTRDAKR